MGRKVHIGVSVAVAIAALAFPATAGAASSTVDGFGQFTTGVPSSLVASPAEVTLPGAPTEVQASNSGDYALVDGSVYAWGYGSAGELGDASTANSIDTPVEVEFQPSVTITDVGDSFNSGYAVDSNGNAYAWGYVKDDDHCLTPHYSPVNAKKQTVPTEIGGLPPVSATAGGGDHSLWLAENGMVWACGLNKYGELGDGTFTNSATPVEVTGLSHVVAISAGYSLSAALTATGQLYTWGQGRDDGVAGKTNQDTPQLIPGTFSSVYVGGSDPANGHTLALTTGDQVEAWGAGYAATPTTLSLPFTPTSVMAAGGSSGAIDSDGNVWRWNDGKVSKAAIIDTGKTLLSGTADAIMDS